VEELRDTQLIARVSGALNAALKAYAASLSVEFGVPVTAAAAARRLLVAGLEANGFPVGPDTRPKPKRGRPLKKKAAPAKRKAAKR
jgi:hypothetical protein